MADSVATTVLYESKSDYVALFTNVSDGTGEAAVTVGWDIAQNKPI